MRDMPASVQRLLEEAKGTRNQEPFPSNTAFWFPTPFPRPTELPLVGQLKRGWITLNRRRPLNRAHRHPLK
jgi:hypothetical protein